MLAHAGALLTNRIAPGKRTLAPSRCAVNASRMDAKDDRATAVRVLPRWDEIDAWRSSMPKSRQLALNNPREVVRAYRARGGAS